MTNIKAINIRRCSCAIVILVGLFTDVLYGDVVLIFTVMLLASVRFVCCTSYTIIPKLAKFKPNREFSVPINVIHVTFLMAAWKIAKLTYMSLIKPMRHQRTVLRRPILGKQVKWLISFCLHLKLNSHDLRRAKP